MSRAGGQPAALNHPNPNETPVSVTQRLLAAGRDKLQATLRLPGGYEKRRSYPAIVQIYERLSQNHPQFAAPAANGFNAPVYTSNGCAVLPASRIA